ncbi:hypothetical protein GCM10009616_14310 [Microlunatus lacustris]
MRSEVEHRPRLDDPTVDDLDDVQHASTGSSPSWAPPPAPGCAAPSAADPTSWPVLASPCGNPNLLQSRRREAVTVTAGDLPTSRAAPGGSARRPRPRAAGWDLISVVADLLLAAVPVALVIAFVALVLQRLS